MKDSLTLDSLDAVKALSDPRRLKLLKALIHAPMTAKDLTKELGEEKSRLYYHLNEMEKWGLIEVVEEHQRRNFIEKVYRATASHYSVDRGLFTREHGMEVFYSSVTSILDTTAADVLRLIESGRLHGENVEEVWHAHRRVHLTAERRDEFRGKFNELLAEFGDDRTEETDSYAVSFVVYPAD